MRIVDPLVMGAIESASNTFINTHLMHMSKVQPNILM